MVKVLYRKLNEHLYITDQYLVPSGKVLRGIIKVMNNDTFTAEIFDAGKASRYTVQDNINTIQKARQIIRKELIKQGVNFDNQLPDNKSNA